MLRGRLAAHIPVCEKLGPPARKDSQIGRDDEDEAPEGGIGFALIFVGDTGAAVALSTG